MRSSRFTWPVYQKLFIKVIFMFQMQLGWHIGMFNWHWGNVPWALICSAAMQSRPDTKIQESASTLAFERGWPNILRPFFLAWIIAGTLHRGMFERASACKRKGQYCINQKQYSLTFYKDGNATLVFPDRQTVVSLRHQPESSSYTCRTFAKWLGSWRIKSKCPIFLQQCLCFCILHISLVTPQW